MRRMGQGGRELPGGEMSREPAGPWGCATWTWAGREGFWGNRPRGEPQGPRLEAALEEEGDFWFSLLHFHKKLLVNLHMEL